MSVPEILQSAVRDNAALCGAMWGAHGLGVDSLAGCAACRGAPPPLFPNVVTVDPSTDLALQTRFVAARAMRARGAFFVKDSYRSLPLADAGFEPLFDAFWIHRPAGLGAGPTRLNWRLVTDAASLQAWEAAWGANAGGPPTFTEPFMTEPRVKMMAGWMDDEIAAGCIVTESGAVAGLSNVFGDASDAVKAAAKACGRRDLVGYETGDAFEAACKEGFRAVGELRVWKRP